MDACVSELSASRPGLGAGAPDFAALFRLLPSPYMILDRDLRYVEVNDAYCEVLERRREDLIGAYLFDAFPDEGDSGRRLLASFHRVLDTGEPDTLPLIPYAIERPAARGGGFEMRYWSAAHVPLKDAEGRVVETVEAGKGEAATLVFAAAGGPVDNVRPNVPYRLRVTTAEPGETGQWRLELSNSGRTDVVFPGEAAPFPVRTGCRPLPPIGPRRTSG